MKIKTIGPAFALGLTLVFPAGAQDLTIKNDFLLVAHTNGISEGYSYSGGKGYLLGVTSTIEDNFFVNAYLFNVRYGEEFGYPDPSHELDLSGGGRHSVGKLNLEYGLLYARYIGANDSMTTWDNWRFYAKGTYNFTDNISLSQELAYKNNDSIRSITTANASKSYEFGNGLIGYVSGELGHAYYSEDEYNFTLPDYKWWSVGIGVTKDTWTVEARYTDSSLNAEECTVTSGFEDWCKDMAVLSVIKTF